MTIKNKFSLITFVIVIIVVLCGFVIYGITYLLETYGKTDEIVYDAEMISFYPCVDPTLENNAVFEEKLVYPYGVKSVFVCGELKTSQPLKLIFYYRDESDDIVWKSASRRYFENGMFYYELDIENGFAPGIYVITVTQAWRTLGETKVEIRQNQ